MRWLYALCFLPFAIWTTFGHSNFGHLPSPRSDFPSIQDFQPNNHVEAKHRRQTQSLFLNDNTTKFAVNGTGIPDVDFDLGESYAGLLPIGDANNTNQLYFWFFPSTNPAAEKEIAIWLTGGPGCASSGELMQSNGPFLWEPGVFKPVENDWSWHKLTNIVWVDQPVGTGFSQGTVTATDEFDVAQQFLGFWKNFVDTFSMQGYKVYVTGSSYSGMYCPYIASAMLDANDTTYFNVTGMQIWDGTFGKPALTEDTPTPAFVDRFGDAFALNDTFIESMHNISQTCGYTDYMSKYLVYPPVGSQPANLPGQDDNNNYLPGCDVFFQVFFAVEEVNPCFSPYSIFHRCPLLYDPLGWSDGYDYSPAGSGPVYLDRPDVKAVIHAPADQTWVFCTNNDVFVNGTDNSLLGGPASQPVLPNVIDRTQNVIIGHGSQDFVLIVNGTLMMIQNLTFGGQLGFQNQPSTPLFIPYQSNDNPESMAGGGIAGIVHTERGLTFLEVDLSGHFLTRDAPAVAFRSLEVLLGRIDGFQSDQPFPPVGNSTTPLAEAQSAVNASSKAQKSGSSILNGVGMCKWIFWAGIPISVALIGFN